MGLNIGGGGLPNPLLLLSPLRVRGLSECERPEATTTALASGRQEHSRATNTTRASPRICLLAPSPIWSSSSSSSSPSSSATPPSPAPADLCAWGSTAGTSPRRCSGTDSGSSIPGSST